MIPGQRIYQSRAWMHRQYVILGKSEDEIAELAGCSRVTIHMWLEKFELLRRRR